MVGRSGGTQVVGAANATPAFEAGLKAFVKASSLAQFDHPALIRCTGSARQRLGIVMPFCEGITLRDRWPMAESPDEQAFLTCSTPDRGAGGAACRALVPPATLRP